jgi:hypothetical protein
VAGKIVELSMDPALEFFGVITAGFVLVQRELEFASA